MGLPYSIQPRTTPHHRQPATVPACLYRMTTCFCIHFRPKCLYQGCHHGLVETHRARSVRSPSHDEQPHPLFESRHNRSQMLLRCPFSSGEPLARQLPIVLPEKVHKCRHAHTLSADDLINHDWCIRCGDGGTIRVEDVKPTEIADRRNDKLVRVKYASWELVNDILRVSFAACETV